VSGYKFDYEQKVWGGETLRLSPTHFRASRLYWALKKIPDKKGKLLDVGCGMGDFLEAFSFYRPKYNFFGIDISAKAISQAKKRNLNINFKVADAQKLPFKDNTFDVVTCFDLIEHVKYPKLVLSEIHRVLKKRGIFHGFIPTESELLSIEGILIRAGWKAKEIYGGHPQRFSKKQIINWLDDAEFKIIRASWDEHTFKQLLEIVYFSLLSLRGENVDKSFEGYLASSKSSLVIKIPYLLKNIFATISYIEARLLWWFPGLGIHLTCRKK